MAGEQRRLAAIVSADVVGYSRLMGRDERGTLAALKAHRAELTDPTIAKHGGRIVKTTGDGLLVEFASVVSAVDCCVATQDGMMARNAGVAEDEAIRFRMGIHLGDVIVDGDDIFGDGVNIAARLQEIGAPDGVTVSAIVHDYLDEEAAAAFADLGERELKNIRRPVRVWQRVTAADEATRREPLALPDKPSIAVLPFDNMSSDPDQEFFADGIAEDIITALSKVRWFFVIARNSTFAYKGKSPDLRQVGRELGVRYVLEGSLRKAADRVRVAAQLIDGTTGNHIWAERYDRQVVDIFAVQDDITRNVVGAIEPQLYAAENLRLQSKPPESLDAWGCVVRGLWHIARLTREDNEQARQLLRQAVDSSPGYAKAHSVLAFAEARTVFFGGDVDTVLAKAYEHAQTAMALDGDDPWSFFAAGYIVCFHSRYDEAIAWYNRAIELNENFALAHGNIAGAQALGGQPEAAIEAVDRALRMSPRDPFNYSYRHFAAIAYFAAERYADGIASERQALRERPSLTPALRFLAACHVGLGQVDEARRTIADVLRLVPGSSIKRDVYGQVAYARDSDRERYADALRKAGLPEE